MSTLIAWFGDTHGHLKLMWSMARVWQNRTGHELDYIFQVGDFGAFMSIADLDPSSVSHAERHDYSLEEAIGDFHEVVLGDYEIPTPTYFIRGNHENQKFLLALEKQHKQQNPHNYLTLPVKIHENLFYVPDGHIIKLNDHKIAAWGGCWGEKTWNMGYWSQERAAEKKNGYARRLNHMTRDVFEHLIRSEFEILVTHDAPTGCGLHGAPRPELIPGIDPESITNGKPYGKGVPHIRNLIETVQPRYHFCGHWHEFLQNQIGQTTSFVLDKVHPDGRDRSCMEVIELY